MADAAEPSRSIDTADFNEEKKLKYLEFVQVAAMYALVCFSSVYEYAKENAGPLKPGVETVEGTVKTVIGPVYEKFQDLPFQLLKFVDRKVDESLDRHVPRLVKQASNKALLVAQRTPEVARELASEVQRTGLVDAAKNAYAKYEPVAEQYAVSAWRSLNRLPLVPQVAQIVVPTAAYWSEKYNGAVCFAAERGIPVAAQLPLVPTERIVKAFDEAEHDCPAVATHG